MGIKRFKRWKSIVVSVEPASNHYRLGCWITLYQNANTVESQIWNPFENL